MRGCRVPAAARPAPRAPRTPVLRTVRAQTSSLCLCGPGKARAPRHPAGRDSGRAGCIILWTMLPLGAVTPQPTRASAGNPPPLLAITFGVPSASDSRTHQGERGALTDTRPEGPPPGTRDRTGRTRRAQWRTLSPGVAEVAAARDMLPGSMALVTAVRGTLLAFAVMKMLSLPSPERGQRAWLCPAHPRP